MLSVLGWAIVFVSLVQITNAILQAIGKVYVPVIHMVIGGAIKILINYVLVSNPAVHINGAPVGTIVCYALILILNLFAIRKEMGVKYSLGDMLLRPLFSTIVMGGVVLLLYSLTMPLGRLFSVMIPIAGGAATYGIMLLTVRALRREDILLLPKGTVILRILEKTRLIR